MPKKEKWWQSTTMKAAYLAASVALLVGFGNWYFQSKGKGIAVKTVGQDSPAIGTVNGGAVIQGGQGNQNATTTGSNSPIFQQSGTGNTQNVTIQERDTEEQLSRPTGLLKPANDPLPDILQLLGGRMPPGDLTRDDITISNGEMAVFLGDVVVSTPESAFTVIRLYGKEVLKVAKINGGLAVSADIWGKDEKIVATIETNQFTINLNRALPMMRPDEHTLLVRDEKKEPVLYVRFMNPNAIRIAGLFRGGSGYPVLVNSDGIEFGPFVLRKGVALHAEGSVLLEWPGPRPLPMGKTIQVGKATFGAASNNGSGCMILDDGNGNQYTVMQIGGPKATRPLATSFILGLIEPRTF
jgi:hypothetical protein